MTRCECGRPPLAIVTNRRNKHLCKRFKRRKHHVECDRCFRKRMEPINARENEQNDQDRAQYNCGA